MYSIHAALQVSLYDLRTLRIRKTLQAEGDRSQCISLAFSHDSNLLLTQGGAPDWNLVLWNWAKARPLAKIRTSETLPVYQVGTHVVAVVRAGRCVLPRVHKPRSWTSPARLDLTSSVSNT